MNQYGRKRIEFENIKFGYQRIVYGLLKKIVIADRLAIIVDEVFDGYSEAKEMC